MADLQTVKIRDLIETQTVMTTDYLVLEKDTGTFKCQARYLKGATGLTPNITIGNTTTLASGQLATVTKRGNTENPVFDFGIPQGVQGPIGPIGPKGDTPSIAPLQTEIDNRFNALTSQQQGNSEVIEARGGYPALKARLDAINDDLIKYNDQTIVTHSTENDFSSISATKNGYLDNILLEGKTLVVDSNNNIVIPGTQGATLKSVGDDATEIKLKSIWGKGNLISYNDLLINKSVNVNGIVNTDNGRVVTELIRVKPNTNYYFKGTNYYPSSPNRSYLCQYNKNKIFVGTRTFFDNFIFTTGSETNYVRLFTHSASQTIGNALNSLDGITYNLYEGNVDLNNIYKSSVKKLLYKDTDGTWKKPTLRQWDSIEKHSDGKYYYHKRSDIKTLVGVENIILSDSKVNVIQFRLDSILNGGKNGGILICDKFAQQNDTSIDSEGISSSGSDGSRIYIRINKNKLNTLDVQGFKNWLQNNNVNILYQLTQEQIFECSPIDLISYDTQTNYSIECGPIYPKTTLKVNSYLGNVVSILKDKVSYLENMLIDGLKLVVAGNMQELAYQLYPQDFVSNVDDAVDMEVIK